MTLRMITEGQQALALYHSQQSVGLMPAKKRFPVTFPLAGEKVVDYVDVDINGLNHIDTSGWNFFFLGKVVYEKPGVIEAVDVSGFYDARLRKGHINLPQADNLMIDLVRARMHRLVLLNTPPSQVVDAIKGQCQAYKLPRRIADGMANDLLGRIRVGSSRDRLRTAEPTKPL